MAESRILKKIHNTLGFSIVLFFIESAVQLINDIFASANSGIEQYFSFTFIFYIITC